MIYASACDGIGAVHVAWEPLGWECAWTAEIEPFPAAVVEHHYGYPNLGDITEITDEQLEASPIDLLVGGTPCQSFSVAGKRAGLDDPRGVLAFEFLAIADRARPEWVVWENVPGVLSSDEGRDFGSILGALGDIGYGFAYRVLDAQYFGVPQRRRRVFVVGHLGSWRRAAAVLLERESLSGNPAPGKEAGEAVAATLTGGVANGGRGHGARSRHAKDGTLIPVARSLNAHGVRLDGESETFVAHALRGQPELAHREDVDTLVTHSLRAEGFDASEDGTGRGTPLIADTLREHPRPGSNSLGALAFQANASPSQSMNPSAVAPPLDCGKAGATSVQKGPSVRRLTPRECERLQGFPDDYTLVDYRDKPAADSPRYKALGNSMAVPVMRWIGERINAVRKIAAATLIALTLALPAYGQQTAEAVTDSFTFSVAAQHVTVWVRVVSQEPSPIPEVSGGGAEWNVERDASASPKRRLFVYRSAGPVNGTVTVDFGDVVNAAMVVLEHAAIIQSVADNWNDGQGAEGRALSLSLSLPQPLSADSEHYAAVVLGHRTAELTGSTCAVVAEVGLGLPMIVVACPSETADWAWATSSGDPTHWMAAGIEVGTAEPQDPCAALAAENALLKAVIATLMQPKGSGR